MFDIHGPEDVAESYADVSEHEATVEESAAMLRAEADHLDATLYALVARLSGVPGLSLTVSYRHGKLRRLLGDLPYINDLNRPTGPIHRITIRIGPDSYWLVSDERTITCGHEPRPPGDGDQELGFSAWAKALLEEISKHNMVNHDSLVALRQLVEHDRVD
jgi:hypothetical protein